MKKFQQAGEIFLLSSYRLCAAPVSPDAEDAAAVARTLCEDACCLSAAPDGQTSLEILRITASHTGGRIEHILTVRTHGRSETECATRQEALTTSVLSLLHHAGYTAGELSYEGYRQRLSGLETGAVWALRKRDRQEYGVQGTYRSPSLVRKVDWKKIYTALDGSGCGLCIQIIPSGLTDAERQLIAKSAAQCSQASDGVVPSLRDSLAGDAAERWKYCAREAAHPFAEVNILITGPVIGAALVTARVKQALQDAVFQAVAVPEYPRCAIYSQPWQLVRMLRNTGDASLEKWTAGEVAHIFQLPVQTDFFIGIEENAFSLMPETDLLPEELTGGGKKGLVLGKTIFSDQTVCLPLEQLLLHTAVLGKSGVGKTTLLKQLIAQLRRLHIPVLILEPVKREYRDLTAGMPNSRIFTVERPVTPLGINPFYPPARVPLGEYRSSLLSAFKAAFSLPDPLPSLFEKAIAEAYTLYGWTDTSTSADPDVTVFDMADFVRLFKRVIACSSYSGEVKGNMMSGGAFRLESLLERCPRTFDTLRSTPEEDLLNGCTVLEMGSLEPEQKSLVTALTLIRILAFLKATRTSSHTLRNIILIDEAHALLDQGEGATQEEKALNSTMTQLMINIITEIRAYGVGVIFSDQSPSRVGGRLLDNVDTLLSFRLSGEEAEMLRAHIGAETTVCSVFPVMDAGEFLLKNRFLSSALPVRMEHRPGEARAAHVSDAQIAQAQQSCLAARAGDSRPFALCGCAGCGRCAAAVREKAKLYAAQIFAARQTRLKTPQDIAGHLLRLPDVLAARTPDSSASFRPLCGCTAVHLLRKCSAENGITLSQPVAAKLLSDIYAQKGKWGTDNG